MRENSPWSSDLVPCNAAKVTSVKLICRIYAIKKRGGGNSPHHEMLECMTSLLKVETEVVHNSYVVGKFRGWGKLGEPAAFSAFREVDPTATREGHLVRRSGNALARRGECPDGVLRAEKAR